MKKITAQPLLTPARVRTFRRRIYDYYKTHGRDLPWRKNLNPYRVLVSEIMLQQTQVERVLVKYREFLAAFPGFSAVAKAPRLKILTVWSGLGYNRRALALQSCARKVIDEYRGRLPSERDKLLALPGIGKYTAGAVMAFAFNKSVVFMDTNIRRVYIHEFFHDRDAIHDDELIPLIESTIDRGNPRKWYNALMDYGAMLKRKQNNPNRRSAHFIRQTAFENSNRQVRGLILKALVKELRLSEAQLVKNTGMDPEQVKKNLIQLEKEGFIKKNAGTFSV